MCSQTREHSFIFDASRVYDIWPLIMSQPIFPIVSQSHARNFHAILSAPSNVEIAISQRIDREQWEKQNLQGGKKRRNSVMQSDLYLCVVKLSISRQANKVL